MPRLLEANLADTKISDMYEMMNLRTAETLKKLSKRDGHTRIAESVRAWRGLFADAVEAAASRSQIRSDLSAFLNAKSTHDY